MTHQEIVSKIISNLIGAIEMAPAVKKDPEALIDLISVAEEFRVAARILRDIEGTDDVTPIGSSLDEQVIYARKVLQEAVGHYQALTADQINQYTQAGLIGMLEASEEAFSTARAYAA